MPRKKRDSFDALAEVMRQNPKDVLVAAEILQRHRATQIMGVMFRSAVEQALAPKRKGGRPKKELDLSDALLCRRVRQELDFVAGAIASGDEDEIGKAAGRFSAKKSRPVALEAMTSFRAEIDDADVGERKRKAAAEERLRVYAARVILMARGYPSAPEEGQALLRRLRRGSAVRASEIAEKLGIGYVREEKGAALLAAMAAAKR